MLQWSEPKLQDLYQVRSCILGQHIRLSDLSFTNLFLLQEKYEIKIAFHDGFLLRRYGGSRNGFAFPVGVGDPSGAVEQILRENPHCRWILLTREQVSWLNEAYPDKYSFICDLGDWDYLYTRESLANLSGKKYEKKRNHVSQFARAYQDVHFEALSDNTEGDALAIAESWLLEHGDSPELRMEYREISHGMAHRKALGILGGVLYVGAEPVGMTAATEISPGVLDVHFEKVVGDYARNGGYAVINQQFAQSVDAQWLNREEDINLPGLRKAKLSYQPAMLLEKYCAQENDYVK